MYPSQSLQCSSRDQKEEFRPGSLLQTFLICLISRLGIQHNTSTNNSQSVFKTWMISSMWNLLRTSQHPYVRLLYIGAPYGTRIASLFTAADNSIRRKKRKPCFPTAKVPGPFLTCYSRSYSPISQTICTLRSTALIMT